MENDKNYGAVYTICPVSYVLPPVRPLPHLCLLLHFFISLQFSISLLRYFILLLFVRGFNTCRFSATLCVGIVDSNDMIFLHKDIPS